MKHDVEQLAIRLLEIGKHYEPALLPKGIKRWPIGRCFDACLMTALEHPELRYVEGVAMCYVKGRNRKKLRGQWILHAWLTDGEHAYDPTWKALDPEGNEQPMPAVYIGVEMDARAVADFCVETEYAGVIANRHRAPELAKKAIPVHL